jgi:hypothetical protein
MVACELSGWVPVEMVVKDERDRGLIECGLGEWKGEWSVGVRDCEK